jgi:hypothetical protein
VHSSASTHANPQERNTKTQKVPQNPSISCEHKETLIGLSCGLKVQKDQEIRAGRSVWYDRHVGIVEVAGSNPASSTIKLLTLPWSRLIAILWAFSQIFCTFNPISVAKFVNSGLNSTVELTSVTIFADLHEAHVIPLSGYTLIGMVAGICQQRLNPN